MPVLDCCILSNTRTAGTPDRLFLHIAIHRREVSLKKALFRVESFARIDYSVFPLK